MQSGTWEIRAWLENAQAPGVKIEEQVFTERLSSQAASQPVANVIFGTFYSVSTPPTGILAEDGVISGTLQQSAVAPFGAHEQNVQGTYSSSAFRVQIDMTVVPGVSQWVEGRLADPES